MTGGNLDHCNHRVIKTRVVEDVNLTLFFFLNVFLPQYRILVMDGGQVAEFAAPQVLLRDYGSAFSKLVGETGSQNAALLRAM